jgi:hypothetical protein
MYAVGLSGWLFDVLQMSKNRSWRDCSNSFNLSAEGFNHPFRIAFTILITFWCSHLLGPPRDVLGAVPR